MDEEERTIEINIILDKPYVFVLLLLIILLETGYIGYMRFFPKAGVGSSDIDLGVPETPIDTTGEAFNFTEPETFEELRADLIAVGVEYVIDMDMRDWHGRHLEANYTEALELAKEAAFVGVNKDVMAFIMYLDGEFLIWFKS